jgi:hypothetical protein
MVLLASDFDKSKYFKAADLETEKKLRIKSATEEQVGERKEQKLVVWFTNDERGLVLRHRSRSLLGTARQRQCRRRSRSRRSRRR